MSSVNRMMFGASGGGISSSSNSSSSYLPLNIGNSSHQLPSNRSTLRMREKYILLLTVLTFAVFCVGGFFFLPELKAGTQFAYRQIKDAGPDLLGLIPPVDRGPSGSGAGPIFESEKLVNPNIPAPEYVMRPTSRAKISDMQILANKIREEMRQINISQNAAVIPKPFDVNNSDGGHDSQRDAFPHERNPLAPDDDHMSPQSSNWNHHNHQSNRHQSSASPKTSVGFPKLPSGEPSDPETKRRRDVVKNMMRHGWDNYVKYAWGENELRPISRKGHSPGIFGRTKLGASIVDAMDTLYIMEMYDEFDSARKWVSDNLSLENVHSDISVFEFNIRFIGGLLSCYALTGDHMFVDKADSFARKMLPAFDTPTGIPYALINPRTGYAKNYAWASSAASILAEFGSLHLEFVYLSQVTGDPIYKEKVDKIRDVLKKLHKPNGLYPNYLNPKTGSWGQHHMSMGALGDSFYEYLLKSWIQSGKTDRDALKMYDEAISAVEKNLIQTSAKSHLIYLADMKYDRLEHKMDHLACFAGGLFALGSQDEDPVTKSNHMRIAAGLANTCHESYIRTETKIGPESFRFTENVEAVASRQNEKYYILRPETVEAYFYLWRLTKDQKYRDWAWGVVEALEKHCRVEFGYSGLKNVYDANSPKDDVQQSFLFAELLKYLYLIFSDDDLISFDEWVFNTEAHPLPIRGRNPAYPASSLYQH